MTNANDYFREGRLDAAIAAAAAEVKTQPANASRRSALCQFLCLAGDLDRADLHLETIARQDASAALSVMLFRRLVRAEQSRRDFYERGRPPELLTELTPLLRRRLEAALTLRDADQAGAASILAEINDREAFVGELDGAAFRDFRDLDDLTANVLELLLPDGRFVWLPLEAVETLKFHRPAHLVEFLWRRATISIDTRAVADGPTGGDVYVPALYHGTHAHDDPEVRLGRATVWMETPIDGGPALVRGAGQRLFLVGDESLDMASMGELKFAPSRQASPPAAPVQHG